MAHRFNRIMAFAAAIFLCISTASYLFWPQRMIFAGYDFYTLVLANLSLHQFSYITMILSALASLAVILAFKDRFFADDRGLLRWAALLGLAGYLMVVINFSYIVSQTHLIALNYADQHIQYKGLGVFLDRNPAGEMALAPVSGSPAEKAGILTGDVLLRVNDTAVEAGASLDAVNTLLYNQGTDSMTLTVRTGSEPERQILIQRGEVNLWETVVQKSLLASGIPQLDPHYILGFGLPGLWFLAVNIAALVGRRLPRPLAILGILVGLLYLCIPVGFTLGIPVLILAGQAGGILPGPAWFIWAGVLLGQEK